MTKLVESLLNSSEPAVRFRARAQLMSENPQTAKMLKLRKEIRSSPRVRSLLSERKPDGKIPRHPYAKWDGAHWILAALADLCYPPRDRPLVPLREQVYEWLLSREHEEYTEARPYRHHPPASLMSVTKERPRIHASMEGNAVWSLHTLGLFDAEGEGLVDRLLEKQWPDGGWNCDGDPRAVNSSFMESLLPLRALSLHAKLRKSSRAKSAAKRAAEVFLKRRLYKTVKNGRIIDSAFTKLHYPCYWHYDVLFGLRVMAEAGFINDSRCGDALDLLEAKRLSSGGFPVEAKYYRTGRTRGGRSLVAWGPVGEKLLNEFVTVDALFVLKEAGRWKP